MLSEAQEKLKSAGHIDRAFLNASINDYKNAIKSGITSVKEFTEEAPEGYYKDERTSTFKRKSWQALQAEEEGRQFGARVRARREQKAQRAAIGESEKP